MPETSAHNNVYFAAFVDEHSSFLQVYTSSLKGTAAAHIKNYIERIHESTPHRITDITMDNAKEHFTHDLKNFCNEQTITTHPTIPYTLQENATAEGVNQTLMETIRAFLHTTNLPFKLWDYALHAAVDYYNHAPY